MENFSSYIYELYSASKSFIEGPNETTWNELSLATVTCQLYKYKKDKTEESYKHHCEDCPFWPILHSHSHINNPGCRHDSRSKLPIAVRLSKIIELMALLETEFSWVGKYGR